MLYRNLKEEKSMALLAVMVLILLIMAFQAAVLIYINNQSRVVESNKVQEKALYGSDAGVEWTKYEVAKHSMSYSGGGSPTNETVNDINFSKISPIKVENTNIEINLSGEVRYDGMESNYGDPGVCNGSDPYSYQSCDKILNSSPSGVWNRNDLSPYTCDPVSQRYKVDGTIGSTADKALYKGARRITVTLLKNYKAEVFLDRLLPDPSKHPNGNPIVCLEKIELSPTEESGRRFIEIKKWEEKEEE